MASIADVSEEPISQLISLSGRRAVVTGGARGLGKAIARRMAEAGATVLIADLDEQNARDAAHDLARTYDVTVLSTRLDVANSSSVSATADFAVEHMEGVDIWVNNAGIFPRSPILEMTDVDWDRVLGVNLRGVFLGCREAARRMIGAGHGGVVINVASTAGYRGVRAGLAHYVASKHGVRGLTRQTALELAPAGIRVLAVAPTIIRTEGVMISQQRTSSTGGEIHTAPNRLGRPGVPDDVARVVLFCASDLSLYMTGSTLPVDAGELL